MQDVMDIVLEVSRLRDYLRTFCAVLLHLLNCAVPPSLTQANRIFTLLQPWTITTSESDLINAMVYAHESLRMTGIALQPVMPTKMKDLLDRLGVEEKDRAWEDLQGDEGQAKLRRVQGSVQSMMSRAKDFKKSGVLFPPLVEEPAVAST